MQIKKIAVKNTKDRIVAKNALLSLFIKGFNISVNFLTVPLVLSFLSITQYGIWLTLTAIIGWFALFDLGFGNGLRNHLTIAVANENYEEGKIYVSTTYAALSIIFGALIVIFLVLYPFINWTSIFNAPPAMADDLNKAVMFALLFLFVQFVLKLINTVLLAFQRAAMTDLSNAIIQLCILIGLFILKQLHISSLTALSLVYSLLPVIVFLILNLYYFSRHYPQVRPSYSFVRKTHANKLMKLGLNFFVIQIAALVLYASDNFIITHVFTPGDVTVYNVAYKYFSITNIIFSIALVPFWSMTTKAFAEADFDWIKTAVNKLLLIFFGLMLIEIIQLVFCNFVYKTWTNSKVIVPLNLSIVISTYYCLINLGAIYTNFLNGVGKVRLQLYFATASMLINIPLALFFVKIMHLGILGIPLATTIITAIASAIGYVQYYKLTGSTATGIWNR